MHLYSATQISLFRECERKWAWRYIAGIKPPQNESAKLGQEVDDEQLQPYLREGRPLDFSRESGYIAAPALKLLPEPMSHGLQIQQAFRIPSPTWVDAIGPNGRESKHIGFGFQGFVDLWMPSGGMPGIDGGLPVVCDFKTTGNWKYVKSESDLAVDVQAQLYATWAMYRTKQKEIDLAWVYMATKGKRRAERTHLRVYSEQVAEQFSNINETAIEIDGIRTSCTDPLTLKPNVNACEQYGGCPYRSNCNLSPVQILESQAAKWATQLERSTMANTTQGEGTMTVFARLRAKKAAEAAGGAIEVVGINPPESALPPAPPVGSVAAPEPAPAAEAAPVKRTPGRPKKKDETPIPAPENPEELLLATTPDLRPKPTPSSYPEPEPQTVKVVWAEETICPVAYNPFKVGPFEASGVVRQGETIPQAMGRIYSELAAFAEQARESKARSFSAALGKVGGK